jgi:hypothetical protein
VIVNGLKLLAISAARPIQCRLSRHPADRSCVAIVLARAAHNLVVELKTQNQPSKVVGFRAELKVNGLRNDPI